MGDDVQRLPDGELFAQVESVWAVKDYSPFRNCVRLIGVDRDAFDNQLFNSEGGCQTYVIDLDWRDLRAAAIHPISLHPHWPWCWMDPDGIGPTATWFRVKYQVTREFANSYAYPAFEAAGPTYLQLNSLKIVRGATVEPPQSVASVPQLPLIPEGVLCQLTAFHVGQGMCSVFHGSSVGYVLDIGAGTPVKRKDYLAGAHEDGTPFINELRPLMESLTQASAIVSHPDSDHWRLLDWDAPILSKLQKIFLPAGAPALAFAAPRVKPKVMGLANQDFRLNSRNWLAICRSIPATSDRNGECLVSVVNCEGRKGLLPGDYVYERIATDSNPAVSSMARELYDAVVVPHHGDEASAAAVFAPRQRLESKAFFSAGNHTGYGHPTQSSIASHRRADYDSIDNHTCPDIIARGLLP